MTRMLVLFSLCILLPIAALALSTAFTYQGRLTHAGVAPTGLYDLQCTLYDAAEGGTPVGDPVTLTGVLVTKGLFTVALDFGATGFLGADRWLEIAVRPAAGGSYTPLTSRQSLTPTPYALFARGVHWDDIIGRPAAFGTYQAGSGLTLTGNTFSIADGAITSTQLAADAASLAKITGGKMAVSGANVGIGTSTPDFPLTFANVLGDKIALWGQSGAHYGLGVQSNLLQIHANLSSADIAFGYGSSTAFTETLRIKGTGNVGIGTSTPSAKLDVNGAAKVIAGVSIGSDLPFGPLLQIYGNGYTPAGVEQTGVNTDYRGGQDPWQSFTPTADITLKAIEVLLNPNSADPDAQLTIYTGDGTEGTVVASQAITIEPGYGYHLFTFSTPVALTAGVQYTFAFSGIDPWMRVWCRNGNPYAGGRSWVSANVDLCFRLFSASAETASAALVVDRSTLNVGIGTSTPAYKLHVNGTVAGSGAYVNTSDGRLKTDVHTLNGALDSILGLRGVTFRWDAVACQGLNVDDRQHLGFIAQEVRQVLPQVVSEDANGRLSLAYGDVVPVLVEAMKEQQTRIDQLQADNAALAARLAKLEALLTAQP